MIKKWIGLLLGNLLLKTSMAQSKPYNTVMDSIQSYYNVRNFENIFQLFDQNMQAALPLDKTWQFFDRIYNQYGSMKQKQYGYNINEHTSVYKAIFQNTALGIHLTLNKDHKISGLILQPYQEPLREQKIAANALPYPTEIRQAIQQHVQSFPTGTEVAIAIIQNGQTNYYGVKLTGEVLSASENQRKVFEIGSITKVFTATVLAELVSKHKITLHDAINEHFPYSFHQNIQLNFGSLANHTAGLATLPSNLKINNPQDPYQDYDSTLLDVYLKKHLKIQDSPGGKYIYSNLGAGLLGYALGKSQQSSIQHLMQTLIFDKYLMLYTFTNREGVPNLVQGQDKKGNACPPWHLNALFGAGGLLSTVEDLAIFARAQLDTSNIAVQLTQQESFADQQRVGLGWHIIPTSKGDSFLWHNGGTGGFSSSMAVSTSAQSAVVILSNVSAFHPAMQQIDNLCFALLKNALGQ